MWPYLAILAALAALVLLQLWWRKRYSALERHHREEVARLLEAARSAEEQAVSRQRALFDSMVEGLLLLDAQGRVQLANRRFIQFFNLGDEVQGRTVLEATRSHELTELAQGVARNSGLINRTLRLPGPQDRHVEVNAAPIIGREGEHEGTVIVLHDVSRLRQLEKTREEFVANVSHELRTPLSLIKGYTETLLDDSEKEPEVARKFLRTIDRNAQRLQFLIEDLLAISSLESGRLQMDLQAIPLRELVEAACEDYQPAANERGVRLEADLPDIDNLLANAVKYGRENGRVRVTARVLPDQRVEVCVRDDGPGIPSDSLDRIFERFYRVDRARSRDQGGTSRIMVARSGPRATSARAPRSSSPFRKPSRLLNTDSDSPSDSAPSDFSGNMP
ncbi:MAG: ATP-binding protein [Verrucomicrobia bacterium]|nr:ATP-binding protein [Verrucomicrobiota bacterium]